MPQFREAGVNCALVATASAFLAVGFSRPNTQAHDELKSKFIVATCSLGRRPRTRGLDIFQEVLRPEAAVSSWEP